MTSHEDEDGAERRIHERFDAAVKVDYASGETFLFAYLSNISEMGIFVRTESPPPIGTRLRLRFHIENGDVLELDGDVMWVNPVRVAGDNLNPGMGVSFAELSSDQREQLVALVRTVAYLRRDKHEAN